MSALAVLNVLLSALMNASWNMLARRQRANDLFLQISLLIAAIGLAPSLIAECLSAPVLPRVWVNVLLSSIFLGTYYLALGRGYKSGDFTIVYPLARALPILLVALADMARGNAPTPSGALGIVLVSIGSLLIPLESVRAVRPSRYWNRTSAWILLAALATSGYTIADSSAAQSLPGAFETALRYNVLESSFGGAIYALILFALGEPLRGRIGASNWKVPVLATVFAFGGYTLVLWAFQLSPHASYVIGLRQISIVIGVALGGLVFHERAVGLRLSAALIITLGVVLISLAR
jgi:drug/metabolite transporter (DMT)-like permease